jgi:drug/metabolite transporter (DMT)-like permease
MSRRGLVLFALMSVIWGIPYLFIRVAVAEMPPPVLVLVRTGIGAAILLPIALLRVDLRAVLRHWRWIVAFAAVEIAIPWFFLASAEQHLSSSLAALLIAGVPLVGAAIAFTGGERITRTGLVGLLVGLLGVAAIVGLDLNVADVRSLVAVFIVVVGYAIGPAILSRRLAGVSSLGVMSLSLTMTALIYLPFGISQWPAQTPSTNAIASVVILGVVCTAAAFLLFADLIAEVGPVRATVITYINPAVAAVLGVLVLNETFTAGMAVGLVLVILGSALATWSRSSQAPAAVRAPAGTQPTEPLAEAS